MLTIFSWAITGPVCGWAAGKILAGHGYRAAVDITLRIAGAIVSGYYDVALGFSNTRPIRVNDLGRDSRTGLSDGWRAPRQL